MAAGKLRGVVCALVCKTIHAARAVQDNEDIRLLGDHKKRRLNTVTFLGRRIGRCLSSQHQDSAKKDAYYDNWNIFSALHSNTSIYPATSFIKIIIKPFGAYSYSKYTL